MEKDEGLEELKGEMEVSNVVRIAGKPIEVYTQKILEKFQSFDQIEIHMMDQYRERALYIIRLWETFGIAPIGGYPIKFGKVRELITSYQNKKGSRNGFVNTITLTKHPDHFRFTHN